MKIFFCVGVGLGGKYYYICFFIKNLFCDNINLVMRVNFIRFSYFLDILFIYSIIVKIKFYYNIVYDYINSVRRCYRIRKIDIDLKYFLYGYLKN